MPGSSADALKPPLQTNQAEDSLQIQAAGPSTPLLDDFNRPDENPISQSGAWVASDPLGGGHTLSVSSLQLSNTHTGLNAISYRGAYFPGDVEVYATIPQKPGNNLGVSLLFGIQSEGSSFWDAYFLTWDDLPGTDVFRVEIISNNQFFANVVSTQLEMSAGDTFMARRIGTQIEGWVNQGGSWDKKLEATDSNFIGGKIGARIGSSPPRLDDFGGGAFSPPPLSITTTSLPVGAVGQPYSQTVTATGGTTPYSWTIAAGTLPPGLSLSPTGTPSATISGTPTTAGTYNFTVRVTDSAGSPTTDTQDLSIAVAAPPPTSSPDPPLLDNFNRSSENPVSQGGNWAPIGITGGSGAPLSQNKLRSFPQPGYSYRVTPYLGGDMEAATTIANRPSSTDWLSVFISLQDAGTPAWDGYELRATNVNGGPDRWEVLRVDNGQYALPLASTNFEIAAGGTMLLRRLNGWLQFWWKPPAGSWAPKLVDQPLSLLDLTYQWGMIGAGGVNSGALDDFSGGSLLSLLDQYAPELRHSAFDTYRAGSPAMMTDNISDAGLSNLLVADGTVLAQSNWELASDDLSLGYLNSFYPPGGVANGRQATSSDYLDEVDESRTADAQRMQGDSAYGNKVYGRVVPESGGRITLQYWLFYYFNWHPAFTSEGDHEGDWEMVQFELDALGVPQRAAYSQHDGGEACLWSFTEKTVSGRPIVYDARGTHASYFRTGTKPGQIPVLPDDDYADGNATPVTPSVFDLGALAPSWLNWPGRWGDDAGLFPSPVGPANPDQGIKWSSPAAWADNQEGCWEALSLRTAKSGATSAKRGAVATPPPAPRIVATRVGRRVRIAYSFPVWPSNPARRPVVLLTSVQSSGTRYAPFMKRHRILKRRGVVSQPLGLGRGPFKLFTAAYSREGRSSRTVTVWVREAK